MRALQRERARDRERAGIAAMQALQLRAGICEVFTAKLAGVCGTTMS